MHRDEDIVDIPEHQGFFIGVAVLLLHKCRRVVSPVPAWIQVMRGVVAVIEGEAVALVLVRIFCIRDKYVGDCLLQHRSE